MYNKNLNYFIGWINSINLKKKIFQSFQQNMPEKLNFLKSMILKYSQVDPSKSLHLIKLSPFGFIFYCVV